VVWVLLNPGPAVVKKPFQGDKPMPATLEQNALEQVTLPIAPLGVVPISTLDGLNKINVLVIVSLSDSELSFQAPPINIPGPGQGRSPWAWTLVWTFMADDSLREPLNFIGVDIPHLPGEITSEPVKLGPGPNQLQKTISINAMLPRTTFKYNVLASIGTQPRVMHDPTIVVTPDPIDIG
jgi:hypothetical protein